MPGEVSQQMVLECEAVDYNGKSKKGLIYIYLIYLYISNLFITSSAKYTALKGKQLDVTNPLSRSETVSLCANNFQRFLIYFSSVNQLITIAD